MSITENKVPKHIGIIMDGNGRWAKAKGLDRLYGHSKGVDSVREVVKASAEIGVEYLTIYAFSKENWGRPKSEVDGLMALFCKAIQGEIPELLRQGVRLRFIGQRSSLSEEVRSAIEQSEALTQNGSTLTLVVAINYGARDEITEAVRGIARKVSRGEVNIENIDSELIASHLYTCDIPDPDLIIRTSNELRISNFLLWQMAYAELYFTEVLWPDFGKQELVKAVEAFSQRERRFGRIATAVTKK